MDGGTEQRAEVTPSRFGRAFTLVELLVVVAVIGLLISILLPSMSRARKQAMATVCVARCRELAVGMNMYLNRYDTYPVHQWRLGDPDDTRVRWFTAMADLLDGYAVQACPATPRWDVGRNNSYGYNYKYLGSARTNEHPDNPKSPYERYPVKSVRAPGLTIAFADCDGTGWTMSYQPPKPIGDQDPRRLGNHGYTLDPTYIPVISEQTLSGDKLEPYAWKNWRSYLSDRHLGKSSAIFADGHGEHIGPRQAYRDNRMWNGLGLDPGLDESHPFHHRDPHVDYKHDPTTGQEWRYP